MNRKAVVATFDQLTGWMQNPSNRRHPWNELGIATPSHIFALVAAGKVLEYTEQMIPEIIAMARFEGESWQQIGDALGISRQAAQQRHAAWERRSLEEA